MKSRYLALASLLFLVVGVMLARMPDTGQAKQNIGRLQLGDTSDRVLELLGKPTYTHETCGSVTLPGKARERAEGGCSRSWVYGTIFNRKIEVLVSRNGRVQSFSVYGSLP